VKALFLVALFAVNSLAFSAGDAGNTAYLTGHFYATNGQSKYCIYSQKDSIRIYVRTVDMGVSCPETIALTGPEKWRKIRYSEKDDIA
jgi:hypothetical protein